MIKASYFYPVWPPLTTRCGCWAKEMWLVRSGSWIWGLEGFKFKQAHLASLCGIGSRRKEVVGHCFCLSHSGVRRDRRQVFLLCSSPGAASGSGQGCLLMVSAALFSYVAQTEWICVCVCSRQWQKRMCCWEFLFKRTSFRNGCSGWPCPEIPKALP